MEQSGQYLIAAAREEVWQALNDPDILAACLKGCEEMNKLSDEEFSARVKTKIGPVSATFTADLNLSDIKQPESYTITVAAKGGAAGFGKGVARVNLEEKPEEKFASTLLSYSVEARVGGKLAQVGSRLIDAASRKMADDFFGEFSKAVAPESVAVDVQGNALPDKPGGSSLIKKAIWVCIATALVVGALIVFKVI